MKKTFKRVSVVIPCRNEEKFIGKCLESLLNQTYPKESLEILVVNGASTDKTREVVSSYAKQYPRIKLLENPKRVTPISMNLGIRAADGDYIAICGSHSIYKRDYIEKCARYLEEYGADNVGGVLRTLPRENTLTARAIAAVLCSPWGTGGARFRTGSEKPIWVDTVFGGFYRREVFNRIGLMNENLIRSQDMEFNIRLKRAGGKILLVPEIEAEYYPKPKFMPFLSHNIQDGIWAIMPYKFGVSLFRPRHVAPATFVFAILVLLGLSMFLSTALLFLTALLLFYLAVVLFASFAIAAREKNPLLTPFLVVAFLIRHFGYGIGSMIGIVKLLAPAK